MYKKKNFFIRNQDLEEKIIKLYCEGKKASEVLRELNYPFKTSKSVYDILEKHNIERRKPEESHQTILRNSWYFSDINTKEKAYLLGLMITDGWICSDNGIGFSSIDKELTECLSNELSFGSSITTIKAKEHKIFDKTILKKEAYQYQLKDIQIKNDLIKLGFQVNKTFNEVLPYINYNLMSHLLRGIFDGDGCIYKLSEVNQVGVIFFSGSIQLLNQIRIFLWSNLRIEIPEIKSSGTIYKISYCQNQYINTLMNFIYQDSENLRLNRKYNLWKEYEN